MDTSESAYRVPSALPPVVGSLSLKEPSAQFTARRGFHVAYNTSSVEGGHRQWQPLPHLGHWENSPFTELFVLCMLSWRAPTASSTAQVEVKEGFVLCAAN